MNTENIEENLFSSDNDHQLTEKITKLAGQINAAQYRFLKLIAEFDRREAWAGYGIRSCAHWLNWKCSIAVSAAREKVRVARALKGLPEINTAFEKGELSYSKVRAMTRVATEKNESYLLMIAEHGTAQHMEKLVREYKCVSRQSDFEEQTEIDQQQSRELSYYQDIDGMWIVHAKLPAEEGGLLVKALDAIVDRLTTTNKPDKDDNSEQNSSSDIEINSETEDDAPHDGAESVSAETFLDENVSEADASSDTNTVYSDPYYHETDKDFPTMEQRRADALGVLAEHFLAGAGAKPDEGPDKNKGALASLKGAERCQLILHVRSGAGSYSGTSTGCCCGEEHLDGHWLPPDAARMLACDASLLVVEEDEMGNILNLGRRTRVISAALSRALAIRDGGCQFPGCCETRYVDGHHIKHWGNGGETKLDNLVTLCRFHHRELHRGSFFLTLKPATQQPQTFASRLCFTKGGNGEIIETNPCRHPSDDCDFSAFESSQPEDINSQTAVTQWRGEHMDYRMAIEGLFSANDGFEIIN